MNKRFIICTFCVLHFSAVISSEDPTSHLSRFNRIYAMERALRRSSFADFQRLYDPEIFAANQYEHLVAKAHLLSIQKTDGKNEYMQFLNTERDAQLISKIASNDLTAVIRLIKLGAFTSSTANKPNALKCAFANIDAQTCTDNEREIAIARKICSLVKEKSETDLQRALIRGDCGIVKELKALGLLSDQVLQASTPFNSSITIGRFIRGRVARANQNKRAGTNFEKDSRYLEIKNLICDQKNGPQPLQPIRPIASHPAINPQFHRPTIVRHSNNAASSQAAVVRHSNRAEAEYIDHLFSPGSPFLQKPVLSTLLMLQ